jgi:NADPH:quinone reductase
MREPRNRVVQVRRFGGPDELEVVDTPLPTAGRAEVRVRVLASSVQYTDVLIPAAPLPANCAPPAAVRAGI